MNINDWQVLVVEDEGDSMEFVQRVLEYHGIRSTAARSAEEAVRLLDRVRPTLIVVDLALPGMDGWGLLRYLQEHNGLDTIPRVAMTAYHSLELAHKAVEAGFDAYFAKPLDAASLVHDLQQVVGG